MKNTEKSKSNVKIKNYEDQALNAVTLLAQLNIAARNAWSNSQSLHNLCPNLNQLVAKFIESKSSENQYTYSQNFLRNLNFIIPKKEESNHKLFAPVPLRASNPSLEGLLEKLLNSSRLRHCNFDPHLEIEENDETSSKFEFNMKDSKGANLRNFNVKEERKQESEQRQNICIEKDISDSSPFTIDLIKHTTQNDLSYFKDLECNFESKDGDKTVLQLPADSRVQKISKSIRKQTSFAKTEEWSHNEHNDDKELFHSVEPKLKYEGCTQMEINSKLDMKMLEQGYDLVACDEMSYSSQLTLDHENKFKAVNPEKEEKMVGLLTASERKVKVDNYLDKKRRRLCQGNVRYECRQNLAHQRFRFQGRFIKFEDLHTFKGKYIIDYHGKKLIKPLFQITKEKKRQERHTYRH